jgi:alpha-mannosidase/mannosylglycerate hydrolase
MSTFQNFHGTVHVVFSSHWDREWYLPFQKFRGKLVTVLDRILVEMEAGRLAYYQLDGQFIPVEDYLEIRPEKEPLLRQLIEQGRFKVGPWYNLPDGFLVSGESMVRNFLLGMKRSEAFGQTSKVGWLCDIFGHNSQTPQVLSQLGIDNAILWRGAELDAGTAFTWQSPDGSKVLTHRFLENGYTDFDFDVRKANRPDEAPTFDEMVCGALAHFEKMRAGNNAQELLMFDGGDHMEFDPAILKVIARLNELAGREVFKVSTLDLFMKALREQKPATTLVKGELREPATMKTLGWLIPGVGSSRVPLKQANHAGETLLTLWAEPWCAEAHRALGVEYPAKALELAWEYLLKNHPHDSICGCSTDETHNSMPYRFDQSRHIAEYYLDAAMQSFANAAVSSHLKQDEIGLSVFAPAGNAAQGNPEVTLRLPKDWPQFSEFFGFESKPSLRIYDLAGKEVGYQLLQVLPSSAHVRLTPNHFPAGEQRQGVRLALDTVLEPGTAQHFVVKRTKGPTRNPSQSPIGVGRNTLRNAFLEVTAANDGTLSLTDLKTGQQFHGLLALEDTADIGDGWFHGIALQDRAYLSTGGTVSFGITENGPLLARLHLRVEWLIPAEFDFHLNQRSPHLVPYVVEHLVTLRKGSTHVEIDTTVHNQARDHRLRLLCPTGFADAETYWSDTPFDAIKRPIKRRDTHAHREIQVEMTPQQNWVATGDGQHGLALLAPGQYESAVLDQPDRPLCVTLLRAFRRAVFTDGNEGGQVQGPQHFHLALKPFAGHLPATELFHAAQSIAAPPRSLMMDPADLRQLAPPAITNAQAQPRVAGRVVLSACYLADQEAWTFRVFNPSDEAQPVQLSGARSWEATDLRNQGGRPITEREVIVGPRQILTLRALPLVS